MMHKYIESNKQEIFINCAKRCTSQTILSYIKDKKIYRYIWNKHPRLFLIPKPIGCIKSASN